MDVFLYFLERTENGVCNRILIEDWKSVVDALALLDGSSDLITISRMRVCSNKD